MVKGLVSCCISAPGSSGHTIATRRRGQGDAQMAQPPSEGGVFDLQGHVLPGAFQCIALDVAVTLLVELAQQVRVNRLA